MTIDPTKIDIRFDPINQRMSGVAIHGDVPFDVPFIGQIAPGLWQGGCKQGFVLPVFINHLISLYPWESYTFGHASSLMMVTMYDSEDQAFSQVHAIARWVNSCRREGPTLVHCQAGLNRSSLVVACALVQEGMSGTEAIDLIREKRSPACLCNKSFESWVLAGCP